jgi:hypothetical protein
MRLPKGTLVAGMTGNTQDNIISLEKIGLIRGMRQVAGGAGLFLENLVYRLLLIVFPFVAFKAHFLALRF